MSCYLVDENVISYLTEAGLQLPSRVTQGGCVRWKKPDGTEPAMYRGDISEAERVGRVLWEENQKSFNYRYPDHAEDAPIFKRKHIEGQVDPAQVLASIRCFEYQSCEHPEWEASEAHNYIKELQYWAIACITDNYVWGAPEIVHGRFGKRWMTKEEQDAPVTDFVYAGR